MARTSEFNNQRLLVLKALEERLNHHSRNPTVREMAEHFGVATATMHSWLTKLANEGLVAWEAGRHRSLRCTPQGSQLLSSQDGQSV